MDALSSAVAMKVNLDVQLTLMASSLYRLFAIKIGNGYEKAKSRQLFGDFIDAYPPHIKISEKDIEIRLQKRSHNPLLIAADFEKTDVRIPWLQNKILHIALG